MQPEESEHEMTQQASGGGGGVPTQGTNERANAEATTTTTYESEPPLASDNPSALPSNTGALLPGEQQPGDQNRQLVDVAFESVSFP